jgi:hypothetical protein
VAIFHFVVALAYGAIGVMKMVTWRSFIAAIPVPAAVVFALGSVEVIGALALIVSQLVRTPAWLAPAAACVLAATAVLALCVHAVRAEWSLVPVNLVLIAAALVIAWRRWSALP